jgi:hypothetical protein
MGRLHTTFRTVHPPGPRALSGRVSLHANPGGGSSATSARERSRAVSSRALDITLGGSPLRSGQSSIWAFPFCVYTYCRPLKLFFASVARSASSLLAPRPHNCLPACCANTQRQSLPSHPSTCRAAANPRPTSWHTVYATCATTPLNRAVSTSQPWWTALKRLHCARNPQRNLRSPEAVARYFIRDSCRPFNLVCGR